MSASPTRANVSAPTYVQIQPDFKVVRNFNELRDTLRALNTPVTPTPKAPVSATVAQCQPFPNDNSDTGPPDPSLPHERAPPRNQSTGNLNGTAPTPKKARAKKILCVWDVDDTLVASGAYGVRQSPVFRDSDLRAVFKELGSNTRHLLLSQGSIDDVFVEGSGRLRYLRDYFSRGETVSSSGGKKKKKESKGGFLGMLNCGSGSKERQVPTIANPSNLDKDTVLVRLSRIRGTPESAEDTNFLFEEQPHIPPAYNMTGKQGANDAHWLVVRPSLWGITLASLHTLICPSRNTAFVNGKKFRKLDVVWSFACSGHWDTVFFIDNNLSELGVIKYGGQLKKWRDLCAEHKDENFFMSDYILLYSALKRQELERRYGRDVYVPPPMGSNFVEGRTPLLKEETETFETAVAATDHPPGPHPGMVSEDAGMTNDSPDSGSTPVLTEDPALPLELTIKLESNARSPSAKTPVMRPLPKAGSTGSLEPIGTPQRLSSDEVCPTCGGRAGLCSCDNLSLGSRSPADRNTPSFSSLLPPSTGPKPVSLVVAHLHFSSERFLRIVKGAYHPNNNDAVSPGSFRESSKAKPLVPKPSNALAGYVGQPTFIGDGSLSDEEYEVMMETFLRIQKDVVTYMENAMKLYGYLSPYKLVSTVEMVCVPRFPRPVHKLPSLFPSFQKIRDAVQKKLIEPIRSGTVKQSNNLYVARGDANLIAMQLNRQCAFLDPYLTGQLAETLFTIYSSDCYLSKSMAEELRKGVALMEEPPKTPKK